MSRLVKQQIAHQFSRAAATYDEAAKMQNEMADRLLGQIPNDAKGKLADLGCGTGYALRKLAKQDRFELSAIDLALGMIEFAKAKLPTVTFHCCDLEATPLIDNSIDIVFSNAAIQWCSTPNAIAEMIRICKPGGLILFSTFGPKTLSEIREAWAVIEPTAKRVHHFDDEAMITDAINQSGITNFDLETSQWHIPYDSASAMLRSLKQIGATNASTARQTGLLGSTTFRKLKDVLNSGSDDNGKLTSTFECFFVSATKPVA